MYQGSGSGYDPGYQNILDFATTNGYTLPTTLCQDLQNDMYIDIDYYIGFSKFRHFCVYANDGGSADFACINWADISKNTTRVNAPSYVNKEGFKTNGTTQYLDSNIDMDLGALQDRHLGIRLHSLDTFAMGFNHTGSNNDIFGRYRAFMGAIFQTRFLNSSGDNVSFVSGSKYRIMTRSGFTQWEAYSPTKQVLVKNRVGVNISGKNFLIGVSPFSAYDVTNVTNSFEGVSLNESQVINLQTIIDSYITSL